MARQVSDAGSTTYLGSHVGVLGTRVTRRRYARPRVPCGCMCYCELRVSRLQVCFCPECLYGGIALFFNQAWLARIVFCWCGSRGAE